MKREEFISKYAENLKQHGDISDAFRKSRDPAALHRGLEDALGRAYDDYAKEYFQSKGLGSYFANFLRGGGAIADALGSYLFWAMGGAGFGLKGLGLLAKTGADYLNAKHYVTHGGKSGVLEQIASTETAKIAGEGLLERAAAYLPIPLSEMGDFLRGARKYDTSITRRAANHAKDDFLKRYANKREELRIVPLSAFASQYASAA